MRLVVLDEPSTKPTSTDQNQDQDQSTNDGVVKLDPIKWWLPFRCGQQTTVHTRHGSFGGACNSRGCLTCHQKKIRKSISAIEEVRKYQGSSMYAIVFSPKVGRVKTRQDVDTFLGAFRRLLRRWQRSHGLHFGYWVAETVVKDNEEPTNIPCPIGAFLDDDYTSREKELHEQCKSGNCPICKGRGTLPSVHLHIHLVVCCQSFWFGRGEVPRELEHRFDDFGGLGWWGFCESENLGVSKCQLMKSRKGMVNYVSKACLNYLAKVDKASDERGQVDWLTSQRGAMIASYIYGKKRHRGACGSIYGMTKKTRDVTNFVTVQYEPPKERGQNMTNVFFDGYEPPPKASTGDGVYLETLQVGLKAQDNIAPRMTHSNVLIETELDIELGVTYTTKETVNRYGEYKEGFAKAPTIKTKTLAKQWQGVQVVSTKSLWFRLDKGLLIVGKGSTVVSFPRRYYDQGGLEYVWWLLNSLNLYEYRHWWMLFHYPFDEVA